MRKYYFLILLIVVLGWIPRAGHALPYTVSASGVGATGSAISAQADFEFVSYNFGSGLQNAVQITLTNKGAPTTDRTNLLTGLFFSFSGVGNLVTNSSGFDGSANVMHINQTGKGGSAVYTLIHDGVKDIAPAISNSATANMYQLSNGPFGVANSGTSYSAFHYGISTVGGGLTGFSGLTGGDNYGIAAAGTVAQGGGLYAANVIIDHSAEFWIVKPEGLESFSQITNARFGYGSLPNFSLDYLPPTPTPPPSVPEPSTFLLFGAGLAGLGLIRRRMKK